MPDQEMASKVDIDAFCLVLQPNFHGLHKGDVGIPQNYLRLISTSVWHISWFSRDITTRRRIHW